MFNPDPRLSQFLPDATAWVACRHPAPLLNTLGIDSIGLEMEEPNLERVFLHLTGRALRD